MKAKQYAVIGELFKLRLINKELLLEISRSLAATHNSLIAKSMNYYELIDLVSVPHQLMMLNKIYYSDLGENKFFDQTEASFKVSILKGIRIVRVSKGEFIYSANMPSHHGRLV